MGGTFCQGGGSTLEKLVGLVKIGCCSSTHLYGHGEPGRGLGLLHTANQLMLTFLQQAEHDKIKIQGNNNNFTITEKNCCVLIGREL